MISIVFDTSILVDFLRRKDGAKKALLQVEAGKVKGYVSSITEAELFSGRESRVESKRKAIVDLIKLFEKILVTNEISQKSGEFRRKYNLSLLDCIIAATAFLQKAKIWTKNIEDFQKIEEVEVEEPY